MAFEVFLSFKPHVRPSSCVTRPSLRSFHSVSHCHDKGKEGRILTHILSVQCRMRARHGGRGMKRLDTLTAVSKKTQPAVADAQPTPPPPLSLEPQTKAWCHPHSGWEPPQFLSGNHTLIEVCLWGDSKPSQVDSDDLLSQTHKAPNKN